MEANRIDVKDLVNTGIFAVIYFILFFISGMTGFIPVMTVFYPVVLAVLGGIPCILFFTKINKFGLITIFCLLMGIITFVMGYGPYAIATSLVCGLIADLIMKAGDYKSWKHILFGYCIFSEWVIGSQLIMFIMKDAYLDNYRSSQGDAYADAVSSFVNYYMIPIVIVLVFIGSIIGAYIGKAVLKKHFKRAGIV